MRKNKYTPNVLRRILIMTFISVSQLGWTQNVGINATGATPVSSAALDVDMTNKGMLIPRVALTTTSTFAPVTGTPTVSLLVFNTATAGTVPNNVSPGYYYWDGNSWQRLTDISSPTILGNGLTAVVNNLSTDKYLTGTSINLTPGKWLVYTNIQVNGSNAMAGPIGSADAWVRYTLSSSNTVQSYTGFTFYQSSVISTRTFKSNIDFTPCQGVWPINVTSATPITLYIWTNGSIGSLATLNVGNNPENYFFAIPMQ